MKRSTARLILTITSVLVAALLIINRQFVFDQISVWQYQPTDQIRSLVARTTMNEQGKFYFYASHPSIESAGDFNDKCSRQERGTAILGCYTGRNIYIYNVTDSKLDGIREVTSAHEMLHAAYDRLGGDEKKHINALLEKEFLKLKDDKKFAERMAFYERSEPGERNNELHSIIGTEVGSIDPQLETYYRKYFGYRLKIVELYNSYESVFKDLEARSQALSTQLTSLGNTIESRTTAYNAGIAQLNADIAAFNRKANNGGFSSQAEFQAERNALIARSNQLEAERVAINALIDQYETLRKELEQIAIQTEALNRSIDSTLAPAPSV